MEMVAFIIPSSFIAALLFSDLTVLTLGDGKNTFNNGGTENNSSPIHAS
jgi:hypothetical protein